MLDSLSLPKYSEVRNFSSNQDIAVERYYKIPFRWFYRHKLRMIINFLDKNRRYRNILDFGAGEAEIFREELSKHSNNVTCVNHKEEINPRAKFDVIVCASSLEFCHLPTTIPYLRNFCFQWSRLVMASPLKNRITSFYFWLIGDKKKRNSHQEIRKEIEKYFFVIEYKTWLWLYFSIKAYPR